MCVCVCVYFDSMTVKSLHHYIIYIYVYMSVCVSMCVGVCVYVCVSVF